MEEVKHRVHDRCRKHQHRVPRNNVRTHICALYFAPFFASYAGHIQQTNSTVKTGLIPPHMAGQQGQEDMRYGPWFQGMSPWAWGQSPYLGSNEFIGAKAWEELASNIWAHEVRVAEWAERVEINTPPLVNPLMKLNIQTIYGLCWLGLTGGWFWYPTRQLGGNKRQLPGALWARVN